MFRRHEEPWEHRGRVMRREAFIIAFEARFIAILSSLVTRW